ncbi:glycosyltransferase family 4 protein [Zavarzinella formosa]|uniref:glycosyltransferase family 4 protein n=1 Tax=Zavarzinella formosa TaxID=360055 RepID=UPI0002DB3B12|nr:glycosyltransferase family 4 protein [Zavarzinella formosa]
MTAVRTTTKSPVILDTRVLSGSGGGPDKTLINSPRYLDPVGYRMICAYLHDPDDAGFQTLRQKALKKNVELVSVADRGALDWKVVPRMLEVCRKFRVDVWHGHDYKTNALGLVLKRFHPMRLITTLHGWVHHTGRTPLYYMIDRLTLRHYEKVICVSDDLVAACRKSGVPGSRCELLENGIDLGDYRRTKTPADARQALDFPNRLTIGAAGRLSAEKGFDLLIRAVDQLIKNGRDVQLLIAGEGVEKDNLSKLVGELGQGDRIRLLGYRSDLTALYETMDVYALSSFREGLPNVLLEAMAMRVPVISTAVNGIPRLISHGESGELTEAGSVPALAASLDRVVADEHLRNHYADAARKTVETRYSFAVRMGKLARMYDKMNLRGDRS